MIPGIPLRGCAPAAGGERKRTPWERLRSRTTRGIGRKNSIPTSNDNPLQTGGGCSPTLSPPPDRIGWGTLGNPEKNALRRDMIPGIPLRGCAPAAGGERTRTPGERRECVKDDYPIRFSNDNPSAVGRGMLAFPEPTP